MQSILNNYITHIKKCRHLLLLLFSFHIISASSQNLNNPNKRGPLGTQVNTLSGNLFIPRTDIYIPARGFDLDISFHYNSFLFTEDYGYGKGWTFEYNIKYSHDTTPGARLILWGDGREDKYDSLPGGSYRSPKGFFNTLSQYQPGKYLLTELNGIKYFFDNAVHKKITRMEEPNGNYINFTYTDSLLTAMTTAAGQSITFTHNPQGRLASVVDAVAVPSRTFTYTYDVTGNLKEVKDPLNGKYQYTYLVNGPMKSIADKNNNKIDIIYFPDLTIRELIGCNKRLSFSYDTTLNTTIVTDHVSTGNQVTKYTYQKVGNYSWITSMSGNCCGFNQKFEYDDRGNILKRIDANGNIYTFIYDDRNNVLVSTDPLGNQQKFTYTNEFNNVKTFTDARGKLYTINHDAKGNPVQLIQPGGLTMSLGYASNGDVTSFTDANGNTTTMSYDAYGYLTQVNRPLTISVSYLNDARGNIVSYTDARGFVYTGEYDILSRIIKTTDPYNHSVFLTYDAAGNLTSHKNQNGQQSFFAYDASNRPVQITNAKGFKSFITYDEMDNLISKKDATGSTTTYAYDKLNRMIAVIDALGNKSQFTYDSNGNMVAATSPTGSIITNTYDKLDRIISSGDQNGIFFNREYDKSGNLIRSVGAIGDVTEFTYNDRNQAVKVRDALGNFATMAYDNNGNMLSLTNRNNKTATYAYDALNRMISFTDKNGSLLNQTYNSNSNIISVRDQNNNTTSYERDNLNRQTKVIFPDGQYIEYTYDNIGNILTNRRPDGSVINYMYDSINRLLTKTLPGNNQYSYTYDAMMRLVTATNSSGVVSYSYDALGRKITESVNGKTVSFNYNTPNRQQTIIYPDSSIVVKEFTTRGLLASITKDGNLVSSYQYSPSNRLMQIGFGNGIVSNRQFDFANRLNTMNTSPGNIQDANFTYNNVVNKTASANNSNPSASEQFTYDNNNRLVTYKRGPTGNPVADHTYQYDALGNRTSVVVNGSTTNYTSNNLNQVTGSSGAVSITYTYDNNGNLTYDGIYYKKYDAERRLLLDSISPSNKIVYSYDALGRRISKTINGHSINYVYAGLTQLQQIDAGADTILNSTVFANFLRPVFMTKGSNSFYYHQNDMNSVEALTASNGSLVERYQYDPFGKQTIYNSSGGVIPSSITGNRFGFTGHENDIETKSLHFPAREYSPETGNFNQRDPLGYYAGMGMYQYVNNNPSNSIDLLGLEPVSGSATVDQFVSDGSSFTQGTVAVYEDVLTYTLNSDVASIAKLEQSLATRLDYIRDLMRAPVINGLRVDKALGMQTTVRALIQALETKSVQVANKLKSLGQLGPILSAFDLWWKIETYRHYKAKCPGSDEDLLQQSIMAKNVAFSVTGFNPATWLIHLGDFGTEKIFGKSASDAIVEFNFWNNKILTEKAYINTPWGELYVNPFGPLNGLGTFLGSRSVLGSDIPTGIDAYYTNPVNLYQ